MITLHKRRTWQALIFGINFLLILVTAAFPHILNSSLKWSSFNRPKPSVEAGIAERTTPTTRPVAVVQALRDLGVMAGDRVGVIG